MNSMMLYASYIQREALFYNAVVTVMQLINEYEKCLHITYSQFDCLSACIAQIGDFAALVDHPLFNRLFREFAHQCSRSQISLGITHALCFE